MVGFILGHECVGLGILPSSPVCPLPVPVPLSLQPWREGWAPSGTGWGFLLMSAEVCMCVCAHVCVVSMLLIVPAKASPSSHHSRTSALVVLGDLQGFATWFTTSSLRAMLCDTDVIQSLCPLPSLLSSWATSGWRGRAEGKGHFWMPPVFPMLPEVSV